MWSREKIGELIAGKVEENIHLEYKAANALSKSDHHKREISKDVSSFANSDGGVIIYGIKEYGTEELKHLPEEITPVNRTDYSKEWIENVITGNIVPVIDGLIIYPVPLENANEVIYAIEIPKGRTAHQANDNKYYKRHNFKAIPMQDWEVKDVINRVNRPEMEVSMSGYSFNMPVNMDIVKEYELQIILKNNGNVAAQHIECFLEMDKSLKRFIKKPKPNDLQSVIQIAFNNRKENKITINGSEATISVYSEPLLPQVWRRFGLVEVKKELFEMDVIIKCMISTEFGLTTKEFKLQDVISKKE